MADAATRARNHSTAIADQFGDRLTSDQRDQLINWMTQRTLADVGLGENPGEMPAGLHDVTFGGDFSLLDAIGAVGTFEAEDTGDDAGSLEMPARQEGESQTDFNARMVEWLNATGQTQGATSGALPDDVDLGDIDVDVMGPGNVPVSGDAGGIPAAGLSVEDAQALIEEATGSFLSDEDAQALIEGATGSFLSDEEIDRRIADGTLTEEDVRALIDEGRITEDDVQGLIDSGVFTQEQIDEWIGAATEEFMTDAEIADAIAAGTLTEEDVRALIEEDRLTEEQINQLIET